MGMYLMICRRSSVSTSTTFSGTIKRKSWRFTLSVWTATSTCQQLGRWVRKIDWSCEKNAISDTLPMLSKVYLNTCTCCAWDRNLSNNNSQTSSIVAPPLHQQPTLAQKSFTWALSMCSPAKDCGRYTGVVRFPSKDDPDPSGDMNSCIACQWRWVYPHIHAIDACFVKIWLFQNVQFVFGYRFRGNSCSTQCITISVDRITAFISKHRIFAFMSWVIVDSLQKSVQCFSWTILVYVYMYVCICDDICMYNMCMCICTCVCACEHMYIYIYYMCVFCLCIYTQVIPSGNLLHSYGSHGP